MAFHDVEFPYPIAQDLTGGPEYSTTVVVLASGVEQRNQNWDSPRRRYRLTKDLTDPAKIAEIVSFFQNRKGKAHSFKLKDAQDFYVGMDYVSNVLSFTGQHAFATGDGSTTAFQLQKRYLSGGYEEDRKITRPVDPGVGAIRIYVNAVLKTVTVDYTINYSTGVVTFTSAPPNGQTIAWAGEFRVPARFDTDHLELEARGAVYAVARLDLIEVRE